MVYFLVYYKSMLTFEREMDHSLEDLPEHGLEVLHHLGVHRAAPLLRDDLRHVVRLQQAGITLQSNCLLGIISGATYIYNLNTFLSRLYLCGCGDKT